MQAVCYEMCALKILVHKVLNPVEQGCLGFFMKRDVPASRPVPSLGTGDVPRRPDWDAKILAGRVVPTYEIVSRPGVP